jgi:hypothetical protein
VLIPRAPRLAADVRAAERTNSALHLSMPDARLDEIAARVAALLAPLLSSSPVSPWLSVAEAAEYLRCQPKRVYDLI